MALTTLRPFDDCYADTRRGQTPLVTPPYLAHFANRG